MNGILSNVKKESGVQFIPEKSVEKIIYREGVYPTQGVRPLVSTIQSIVKPNVLKALSYYLSKNSNIKKIDMKFDEKRSIMIFSNSSCGKFEIEVPLNLKKLYEVEPTSDKARIAIHEVGHALMEIYLQHKLPKKLSVYTPNVGLAGYMESEKNKEGERTLSKKDYENKICSALGGTVAEELIFGKENVSSGCFGDLEFVSGNIRAMVLSFGFNGEKFSSTFSISEEIHVTEKQKKDIEELSKKLHLKTIEEMKKHKDLLILMAKKLLHVEKMDKEDIRQFLDENKADYEFRLDNFMEILNTEYQKVKRESKR